MKNWREKRRPCSTPRALPTNDCACASVAAIREVFSFRLLKRKPRCRLATTGSCVLRVPEIGAELEHLAIWVEAVPIPVHDRAYREGVTEIMDWRTTAMFVEGLRRAKADSLADHREVVSGGATSRAVTILKKEERCAARTEDTAAFRPIGPEPFSCTGRYRNETAFAILRASDRRHRFLEIDIFLVKPECFAHTQPGHGDQPEQS
jgi:hypothetical protein